jgi:hypothetical protein
MPLLSDLDGSAPPQSPPLFMALNSPPAAAAGAGPFGFLKGDGLGSPDFIPALHSPGWAVSNLSFPSATARALLPWAQGAKQTPVSVPAPAVDPQPGSAKQQQLDRNADMDTPSLPSIDALLHQDLQQQQKQPAFAAQSNVVDPPGATLPAVPPPGCRPDLHQKMLELERKARLVEAKFGAWHIQSGRAQLLLYHALRHKDAAPYYQRHAEAALNR